MTVPVKMPASLGYAGVMVMRPAERSAVKEWGNIVRVWDVLMKKLPLTRATLTTSGLGTMLLFLKPMNVTENLETGRVSTGASVLLLAGTPLPPPQAASIAVATSGRVRRKCILRC